MNSVVLMDAFVYTMAAGVFATLIWLGICKKRQEAEKARSGAGKPGAKK
jgi:hypothetical protein